jgi:hypothetical protein|tara:strand:+ start:407 stop:1078 length:672 start_codon:yes stop_codon:yes gene_type:complete
MGYLNNETITVHAVLTRKGRELLASENGLNITSFALADDEVDYTLYDPNHPEGSQYYDSALRSIPVFEPLTDETQCLKYKLVTLPPGTEYIPTIKLGQQNIIIDKTYNGVINITPTTEPVYNTTLGYTAVLSNRNVGTLTGTGLDIESSQTASIFLGDSSSEMATTEVGFSFTFKPNKSITTDQRATLTIIGNESGGSTSIPVIVTVVSSDENSEQDLMKNFL